MNGQELQGSIRTLGSQFDNNCIVLGEVDGVEIRMDVKELNKIITILDFDLDKARKPTCATLNEESLDAIYRAMETEII